MIRRFGLFALSVFLVGCSLTLGTKETSLRVQLKDSGARYLSPDFASWSIQGTSLEGTTLPLTVFTQKSATLQLAPGQWTFSLRILDSGGVVIQTAQSTATLVAGPNTAVFALDPVVDGGVGWGVGEDPSWTLEPTGSAESMEFWPSLGYAADFTLTAPAGFQSYVWLLNGVPQPETGNVWSQSSIEEDFNNARLNPGLNQIQVLFTIDGKIYSLHVTVQMPSVG